MRRPGGWGDKRDFGAAAGVEWEVAVRRAVGIALQEREIAIWVEMGMLPLPGDGRCR